MFLSNCRAPTLLVHIRFKTAATRSMRCACGVRKRSVKRGCNKEEASLCTNNQSPLFIEPGMNIFQCNWGKTLSFFTVFVVALAAVFQYLENSETVEIPRWSNVIHYGLQLSLLQYYIGYCIMISVGLLCNTGCFDVMLLLCLFWTDCIASIFLQSDSRSYTRHNHASKECHSPPLYCVVNMVKYRKMIMIIIIKSMCKKNKKQKKNQ